MKSPQFFHCSNCTQLINSLPAFLQMSSSVIKDRKENSSPDASERLRGPEKSEKSSRHYRNNHDFHRRRHHRRANKRGRRNHRPRDSSPNLDTSANSEGQSTSSSSQHRSHAHGGHSHRRPPPTTKNLILRPTKGPLLNAPKNSTQFIIDDHETSPLLGPIHEGGAVAHPVVLPEVHQQQQQPHQQPKKYNTRSRQGSTSSSRQVSACSVGPPDERMELVRSPDKSASNDCQATPGNYVVNDDDYTLWAEFSERDFQSVYESAHQEEVADWDRQKLIEEITNLEKRQKELVNVLAKVDPDMYAQRLQTQLQALQEKNRLLRNANGLSPAASGPNHLLDNAMDQQEPEKSPPYKSPDSSTKDD